MSNTHLKGASKHYFICIGKPHFSGPTKQLKAISCGAFASTSIRYLNASDTILRMKLQEHIDVVANDNFRRLSNRDPDRINTLGNTQNLLASAEATIQPQPPLSTKISDSIDRALALDLRIFPRPDRNDDTKTITLKQTNISNQCTKLIVLVTAISWGLHHYSLTYKNRMRVARAASRMVAYDNGYLSEFSVSSILRWDKEVIEKVSRGTETEKITANIRYKPKKYVANIRYKPKKYVDIIKSEHPGYLHSLFRKAIKLKGPKASFEQLTVAINAISNVASEVRPGLTLHRKSLNRWFSNNGGMEISGLEKPLDSKKHKKLRKEWVITYYGLLTCLYNPVAYIDEK